MVPETNLYLEYLGLPQDDSLLLLELNCGHGETLVYANNRLSCVGIDTNFEVVSEARKLCSDDIALFKANDYTKLGFVDNWFDYVSWTKGLSDCSPSVLYSAFREVKRVLKPSGKFLFVVTNPTYQPIRDLMSDAGLIFERSQLFRGSGDHAIVGRR